MEGPGSASTTIANKKKTILFVKTLKAPYYNKMVGNGQNFCRYGQFMRNDKERHQKRQDRGR